MYQRNLELRAQSPGLRLLALDGGGIRGLSELVILGEMMHRIKYEKKLEKAPLPCEYFDLIGGTSTGGLIAVMLGRLGMSVEEAIEKYGIFAKRVFSKKKWKTQDGMFKATELENAIKEVISSKLGNSEELMRGQGPRRHPECKTFVCAMPASHISQPRLFRTYEVAKNQSYNCKIWEAARATSAAPTLFKRICIGDDGLKEEFIDGGMGCNNPVALVFSEAKAVFGSTQQVACIVSLGTGHSKTIGLSKPDAFQRMLPTNLIRVLKGISTDCETKSQDFEREHEEADIYFRFNVQQGLQSVSLAEWDRLGEVKTHTFQYLQEMAVSKNIARVVGRLCHNYEDITSPQSTTTTVVPSESSTPTVLPLSPILESKHLASIGIHGNIIQSVSSKATSASNQSNSDFDDSSQEASIIASRNLEADMTPTHQEEEDKTKVSEWLAEAMARIS